MERLASLEVALRAAEEEKEDAVKHGRLEDAEKAAANLERLSHELKKLQAAYERSRAKDAPGVTALDVAAVVAHITGAELGDILQSEREELKAFESRLKKHIVGQDQAVRAVAEVVNRSRLGLNHPERPKAALLFVGPSGTGKTETARRLAQELFRRDDALIKIDMTEFSEGHSLSKLVGAPAGYVGYREANKLTDNIRKRPHCVLLFDEFEKAHPDVQNILLQMLEDGTLSDATGRPISLRHAYIVLTTNFGNERLASKTVGFGNETQDFTAQIESDVKQRLRPELLNRLDRIVVFQPLALADLRSILKQELAEIFERVATAQHVAVSAGDDVLEWLLSRPLAPEEGARAVRRLVEREITSLIASLLSSNPQKKKIRIKAAGGNLKTL
jgi:ATP-dependent Clp protease ATP-binding subunit ClpC